MSQPFIIYGDSPRLSTGLARIARDLAHLLWAEREDLGIDLLQCGLDHGRGAPVPWPCWTFTDPVDEWGVEILEETIRSVRPRLPVVFSVWDPARCYPMSQLQAPMHRWGYFPVDSANINGIISGPAQAALQTYDRVLAYGRYGQQVLQASTHQQIEYLPHGLSEIFTPQHDPGMLEHAYDLLGPYANGLDKQWLLGCVATNQPRKDLSLFFGTLAELRRRGYQVYGWLHTDKLIGQAWSIPQLVQDFGLAHKVTVTEVLSDFELAALYRLCSVTLAPGLGEGFGYPIVESLASGVPVVHGDFAGGAECVPRTEWRVPSRGWRLESVYAMRRPVFTVDDFANAVERAYRWRAEDPRLAAEYCTGAVAHLRWPQLWIRWREWFKEGLKGV